MFIATPKICVWAGHFESPTRYSEQRFEIRLVVAPSKLGLYKKLRALGIALLEMKNLVHELSPDGIDLCLLEIDDGSIRMPAERDPYQ